MKKYFMLVLILIFSVNLAYAGRVYTYTRTVGQETGKYDFTTINDAIADIQTYELSPEQLGCIFVYPGTYIEQINTFYPSGHNLPEHCDLIGMGETSANVVIQHQRRSTSDPNFTNIYSEIYADGLLCDGDNIVSKLKVHNVGENQNSVGFIGEGTLRNCTIVSKHNALTALKHLVVKNCDIEGKYLPCIQAYSTFEISDCNLFPKTRPWGGEHPAGIKVRHSGTIDNVTIQADITSSEYEPHYDTPWLAGVILQLRSPDDLVTITNATMNLKLKTIYHDDRPNETADWELFGVVSGGRNPTPTTSYPGRAIVKDCQITLDGVEDSSNPNGDGRAIMVAGVCVQGGGRVDVIGNTSIRTSRTAASFGDEGYEYSLNNQNGILTVDFNTVDFDETITNGLITAYDPNEFDEPNEPNETEIEPPTLKKVLLNCPDNISILPVPDFNRANWLSLSFPSKDTKGSERTFTMVGEGGGVMTMGMDGVIDVNSDITSNQIWTADNTYHVVADVNIQALLVIEPGTVVAFANTGSMSVNNGGTLISVGTPNDPVIYTSDAVEPWFSDYYCPIYIEETASDSTKVTYSFIEYAYAGIVVLNKSLDESIENNYLYNNVYGIVEKGTEHTNICNNLIFKSYYSGIEVFLESTTSQADANSYIFIENNTCDYYQDCGITVHGVPDSNDAGVVVLANNIVSESYQYGLNLVDGYMYASVLNTGYYDNASNKNWEFEEDNPVIETIFPYETGTGYLPVCYLDQDCNFIDTGYGYVEQTQLVGKTTDVNELPDSNYIDIGFHYPNWSFSNAGDGNTLESDFNRDLIVNFKDFAILANGWQMTYDMNDLATLAGEWLNIVSAHPNISVYLSGDPCNLSGDVTVGVDGIAYATEQAFVLIDGEPVGAIEYDDDEEYIILDSRTFRNGQHTIKVVAVDANNLITLSENAMVNFNNELYCVSGDDDFEEGQDYHIAVMYSSGYNLRVKVVDWEESVVWTSPIISGHINLAIPESVFSGQVYDLVVEEDSASWETIWKKGIGKKHVPGTSYKFAVFLPRGRNQIGRSSSECRKRAVAEIVRICELKGWPLVVLYRGPCNWGNFAEVLSHSSVKYVYLVCHGGSAVGPITNRVQRTNFKISSKGWFGCDRVVSYKGGSVKLPGKMETSKRVHSMASLGLGTKTQLRLVQVDGCVQTKYSDMARRWINFNEVPILEQLYSGYKGSCKDFNPHWQQWSYDLWNELSDSGTTYWQAFQEIQKPHNNEKGYEIAEAVQWYGYDQVRLNW